MPQLVAEANSCSSHPKLPSEFGEAANPPTNDVLPLNFKFKYKNKYFLYQRSVHQNITLGKPPFSASHGQNWVAVHPYVASFEQPLNLKIKKIYCNTNMQ